jgi:TolB-like protein/tetratricopeptide (TPR) repeat protein
MDGGSDTSHGQPFLAVLPFSVLGDPAEPLWAEGLYESLCSELTRFRSIRVLSPASAALLVGCTGPEIAGRVRVSHVLRAQLRFLGDRLRLTATLSEAATATQVWSDRIEVPAGEILAVEDEIVGRIVAALNARLDEALLTAARHRPGDPAAYLLVLQGRALLREGSHEADAAARALFERALEIDPACARAHAGLACTWFNEWSCQFWSCFEENGRLAYSHAHRALGLDDSDAFLHQVLGKVCLFRHDFERASWYFDRALALCPNDAELLSAQALYESFLGRPEAGIAHAERAMRLNPYHPPYYYGHAALAHLLARRPEEAVALIERADGLPNVDIPAYWAAAYAHAGRLAEARAQYDQYLANFREKIAFGRPSAPGEEVRWFVDMNPLRRQEDLELFLDAFRRIGAAGSPAAPVIVTAPVATVVPVTAVAPVHDAALVRTGAGWSVAFAGERTLLPELKGLWDIRTLLERPHAEVHCLDLAGREAEAPGDTVLDDRARTLLKARIRDLQEDLADAEDMNDLGRAERARAELEPLIDVLAAALGLGGRARRLGDVAEKARTAVTWRIRHAIRRIEVAHPALGRHLANSVRTGTFCVYRPEAPVAWSFGTSPQAVAV